MEGQDEAIIGICGGVGPAAGLLLHQNILNHTENHGVDQGHLDVVHISRSRDTVDRTKYLLGHETEENPADGMARTLNMVCDSATSRNGSRMVVGVPCNTFHAAPIWNEFVSLTAGHNIELVHMLDETVRLIQRTVPHCKKVGLLSTTGTRTSRVYHDLLEPAGFEVVQVPGELQAQVHDTIYNPAWGIKATAPAVSPRAISNFRAFATQLAQEGAQTIILGCTEIPYAFHGVDRVENAILIDPMVALARGLIRQTAKYKLKPMTVKRLGPMFRKPVLKIPPKPLRRSPSSQDSWFGFYTDFVDKILAV